MEDPRPPRKMKNFRPVYVYFHILNYIFYLFSDSYLQRSYNSHFPLYFYIFTIFYFSGLNFYAKACEPPGFNEEEPENPEGLFFCEKCQKHNPIRCCHCNDCGKCVLRRDHHCVWTGHCIGRDNHQGFYIFIIFEFCSDAMAAIDVLYSLIFHSHDYKSLGFLLLVFVCPWTVFATGQTSVLVFHHTKFILFNVTTWELSRWYQVSYLTGRKMFSSPFSKGFIGNIKEFFSMKENKMVWPVPEAPSSLDSFREIHYR